MHKIHMTKHGFNLLQLELERLITQERVSVLRAIAEARAHGDLSENAEYSAAKELQAFIECRISDINNKISNAEIIDPVLAFVDGKVIFGTTVNLIDIKTNQEQSYQIVGDDEADIKQQKISINSPIAKALIGRQAGDSVTVRTPGGIREFEIKLVYIQ